MLRHALLLIASAVLLRAADLTLSLDAAAPAGRVSPTHYGLMTEEINYSYDGGIYAELVRNRSFRDDPAHPVHWRAVGDATLALDTAKPFNAAHPSSLRVEFAHAGAGLANAGYWGFPVTPATAYRATLHAEAGAGFDGALTVALQSTDGTTTYASATIPAISSVWQAYELTLKTKLDVKPTSDARLVITSSQPGTVWLGFVSLFPPTWNDRPNGLRRDLMQMLVDLKPKFLRFPGGNYLEGDTLDTRFKWWETLGPVYERPGHRGTWGYRSSDGMGLLEFLLWTEDMGAEPVLGLYAGYSLKSASVNPGPDLEPFIREALDEIEYVTGPVASKWGARRAADGHPEPFPLRYVQIGNEDWFDKSGSYDARFAQFFDAIKARYPQLKCISSIGNGQPAAKRVTSRRPAALDEHYYRKTADFLARSPTFFDNYDRSGPEIFVGEWAAHETAFAPWDRRSKGQPATPNFYAALGDAAFMAAMERASDLVTMQCYAPIFANLNDHQWRPDLIGYDALRCYGAPSYYALKLFSTHLGDEIIRPVFSGASKLHASATRDSRSGALYLKLVNAEDAARLLDIEVRGVRSLASPAILETLSAMPNATNTIDAPTAVVPVISSMRVEAPCFPCVLPPRSITVLTLQPR
jgi:alpha-N-arabinofuranosidase